MRYVYNHAGCPSYFPWLVGTILLYSNSVIGNFPAGNGSTFFVSTIYAYTFVVKNKNTESGLNIN